jgi:hypothetical protein
MHKATTFEHGGKVYEVRAIPALNGWKVRIFVEGIPANGFTYSFDSEVYQDAAIDGVPEDSDELCPVLHAVRKFPSSEPRTSSRTSG